ncbi:MAG: homoserine dehydrogenase [Vallitaleaceae bacterium]|nr:homoserine dehydrogenase [Vallitaleaceae bacterium]
MKIRVGLLGLGTVGAGVYQIITKHQEELFSKTGRQIELSKILVRDRKKKRGFDIPEELLTDQVDEILEDPSIDLVIEVMGGISLSYEYIQKALKKKKHVITANKDVIALHGGALQQLAKENECDLFYEASVAGGIPIIRTLIDGFSSDKITKILGIVNGTTNYILTKMSQDGKSYEEALKEAQDLGFAEPDPTADVEGLDAARKILILAHTAFSMKVELEDVSTKGISSITQGDIEYAKQLGYVIKLIGLAEKTGDGVEVGVQPMLIPQTHPLASVHNEYNAVYVYGSAVGETMFYGAGAGSMPTATSIVSDLVMVVRNQILGISSQGIRETQFEKKLLAQRDIKAKFFLRIHVKDEIGVFSKIAEIFLRHHLSFESIVQKPVEQNCGAEIIIITHAVSLQSFMDSKVDIEAMDEVVEIINCFRVMQ